MSFISEFPTEFGLNNFLDYDMMYNKGFIDPLKGILDTIGWKTEHVKDTRRLLLMRHQNLSPKTLVENINCKRY